MRPLLAGRLELAGNPNEQRAVVEATVLGLGLVLGLVVLGFVSSCDLVLYSASPFRKIPVANFPHSAFYLCPHMNFVTRESEQTTLESCVNLRDKY